MPEKDKDILKYNQVNKSVKDPFVIYADIESSLYMKQIGTFLIIQNIHPQ